MADNPLVDNGSLTDYTVSADETASGFVQRIKFTYSADGSDTHVGADANGLDVDVTGVVPGTGATNLGKAEDSPHTTGDVGVFMLGVRSDADADFGAAGDYTPISTDAGGNQNVRPRPAIVRLSATSSGLTTATTNYTIGDQVGAQFSWANAVRKPGGTGYITGITLINDGDVLGPYDLVFTRSSITLAADNAAYAISDADAAAIIALVQLSGSYDIGAQRLAQAHNIRIPFDCSGSTTLYAGLITRAGGAFYAATDDIVIVLHVEQS